LFVNHLKIGVVMSDQENKPMDKDRRNLLIATGGVGALGVAAFAAPLVSSFAPSEKAKAGGVPVEIDVPAPGELKVEFWRGKPVWILHRTDEMTASLEKVRDQVADPDSLQPFSMPLPEYCDKVTRARPEHPNVMVMISTCTHLGCIPEPRLKAGAQPSLPDDWAGGFLCPCHGTTYDLAGRVFKNKPAPQNLDVPPFMFLSDTKVVIGKDEKGEA
jgi:ubiquinol-cytochrome c reductase iron-sulfur subunit